MYVGSVKISLALDESHSLKAKRMVLRRIKDRARERLGVAVNEVGELDVWQRAELGCAVVSSDRAKAFAVLDDVLRLVATAGDARITAIAREVATFDAPGVPVADKPGDAEGDDWIPEAWREELAK